jgi:hypothetical protein
VEWNARMRFTDNSIQLQGDSVLVLTYRVIAVEQIFALGDEGRKGTASGIGDSVAAVPAQPLPECTHVPICFRGHEKRLVPPLHAPVRHIPQVSLLPCPLLLSQQCSLLYIRSNISYTPNQPDYRYHTLNQNFYYSAVRIPINSCSRGAHK